MLSASLARALAARGIHYGWFMVALTMGYLLCSSATLSIPGVLLTPMSRDLGWSIGDLSGPLGLRVALFGLVAPFAGGLMLLYGPRAVITGSATLLIVGLLLSMTMTEKWELWLGLGIILGIASGMTALILAVTVATRWFTARRGLVTGILGAGTATGQLIFLPPAAWLAEHYGWRAAACNGLRLVLPRPAVGPWPCAIWRGKSAGNAAPAHGQRFAVSFAALGTASRTTVFWVLAFTFFICGVSSLGLTPHFVTLCGDYGISPMTSTSLLVLIGVCDLIGTIGSGWLSDRYDNRWLLAWYYGLRGLSLIWLPYSDFTLVGLSALAVLWSGLHRHGAAVGALDGSRLWSGTGTFVFGWIFAGHQIGAGVMALAAGMSRDALASYLPAFFVGGLLCLLATLSLLMLRGRSGPAVLAPRLS